MKSSLIPAPAPLHPEGNRGTPPSRPAPAGLPPAIYGLMAVSFFVMMGMGMVAPILPLFAHRFGVSYTAVGAVISAFAFARLVFDLPGGALSDRFGERKMAAVGTLLVALSSVLCGLSQSFTQLVLFRAIEGAGSALFVTAAMHYLIKIVPPTHMGRAMSLYQGAILLGVSFGPTLGGFIAFKSDLRIPFFLYGLLVLVGFLFVLFAMKEIKAEAKAAPLPWRERAEGIFGLFKDYTFCFALTLNMIVFFVRSGVRMTIVPLYGEQAVGLSEFQVGLLMTIISGANLAAIYFAGRAADSRGRRGVARPTLAVLACFAAAFALTDNFYSMAGVGILFGFAIPFMAVVPAAILADIVPPRVSGTAMGIYRTSGDLGLVLGPLAAGFASSVLGFQAAFAVMGALVFLVFLMSLRARETLGEQKAATPAGAVEE